MGLLDGFDLSKIKIASLAQLIIFLLPLTLIFFGFYHGYLYVFNKLEKAYPNELHAYICLIFLIIGTLSMKAFKKSIDRMDKEAEEDIDYKNKLKEARLSKLNAETQKILAETKALQLKSTKRK
jgi:hypothetical protein